jgi:hypothetical protein
MVRSGAVRSLPVLALLVLAAVMAWSSWGEGGGSPGTSADASVLEAYTGLCRAIELDDDGDRRSARDQFVDIHASLHELAQATTARDRSAGASLLEAKGRVEGALEDGQDVRFDELVRATRRAVEVTTTEDPGACP